MQENFLEDLEYVHAYIKIKKFMVHRIRSKFLVIPGAKALEWIITHMEDSQLVLCVDSGSHFST